MKILFSFILIISLCFVPAFGTSVNGVDFSDQPLPWCGSSTDFADLYIFAENGSTQYAAGIYSSSLASSDFIAYVFLYQPVNDSYAYPVFCYESTERDEFVDDLRIFYKHGGGGTYIARNSSYWTLDSDSDIYRYYYTSYDYLYSGFTAYCPVYSSIADGLADLRDFIDNPPQPDYNFQTTVEIPPGYVAYFGVNRGSNFRISMKTEMPMYTSIGSSSWTNVPQRVGPAPSLPVSGTTFPLSGTAAPFWQKVAPFNLLGQSTHAETSTTSWANTFVNNSGFMTVYNPVYYLDGSIQAATNTVYATVEGYSSIRLYPLQNDLSIVNGSVSTSPSDFEEYFTPEEILDNGDGSGSIEGWSGSDGSSSASLSDNPYNTGTDNSISSYIKRIEDTLNNFVKNFTSLLSAPISHIQELISSGSAYMRSLRQLYAWLPVDIENLISSALTVVVTIGVLKVFL